MVDKVKSKGKVIWLTDYESALFEESREVFRILTGAKISRGAFVCALSLGATASKSLTGLAVRCPNCGSSVVMELRYPKKKRITIQGSVSHSQTPANVVSTPDSPAP